MGSEDRFWAATERAEQDFTGRCDVREFRRRMKRLGHDDAVIRERVEAIRPELLGEFDRPLVRLSDAQRATLQSLVRTGSVVTGPRNRTMVALADKGLARRGGSTVGGWFYWHATDRGADLIAGEAQ